MISTLVAAAFTASLARAVKLVLTRLMVIPPGLLVMVFFLHGYPSLEPDYERRESIAAELQ
jgi:hypothetical protein